MSSTTTPQTETLNAPKGEPSCRFDVDSKEDGPDPAQRARSTSPAAKRMRRYRKRRRSGIRCVRISLDLTEIEDLIRLGHLPEERREDAEALQTAVLTLLYRALDDAG